MSADNDTEKTEAEGLELEEFEAETVGACLRLQTVGRVWAVTARLAVALADLDGRMISTSTLREIEASAVARSGGKGSKTDGGVAVIPLKGTMMGLGGAGDLLSLLFGMGGGLGLFRDQLREAASDPKVGSIVLDIDSPGGLVDHIPEVAQDIRDARAQKPVVAVANTMAASAAYWLASQADQVSVTPSGEAGSVGVYTLHRDMSEAHAMRGIAPTLVSAGKYKVEGNPYEPLTDEAKAALQADVDHYYDLFTSDVAAGRGATQADVQAGYGEGRSLPAAKAKTAKIADRVETVEQAVRRLSSPAGRAAIDRQRAECAEETESFEQPETGCEEEGPRVHVTYTPEERYRLLAIAGAGAVH